MIAENLRYLRNEKGMSQTALAEALDLKRGNISSYEKGLAQPSITNLVKIAQYFEVSMEAIATQNLEERIETEQENFVEKFSHNKFLKNIKSGVQSLTQKVKKPEHVHKMKQKNQEIRKILEGFRVFHKHRMENFDMDKSTINSLSMDYENILKLLDTILKSNEELIELVD